MPELNIVIVSDIHYACAAEQERRNHEANALRGRLAKTALQLYRDWIWLKNPYDQNHLLDQFLSATGAPDFVIANGDYSCNTAFIGVADEAACTSAHQCLTTLRNRFGERFRATIGDHELGKKSLAGDLGGLRVASFHNAVRDLKLEPFWRIEFGRYVFLGITSTLIAFPVFEPESLPEERAEWWQLRAQHLVVIREAFATLKADQKVILFCHDPTALPFLWHDDEIRARLPQVERTIIGHLHSRLVLWKSRLLAGMPVIHCCGNSIRRFSTALREARLWRPFHVALCPSLAGIELLKDGGYLQMQLDPDAKIPAAISRHRIHR